MRKRAALAAFAALAQGLGAIVFAQQPAPQPPAFAPSNLTETGVRSMAANCAPCHGTAGKPAPGATVPGLAGRGDLGDVMKAFKEGKREATVMHQIAKGYSDAEIAALAGYFAKQPR